jgi:hypothetical protein
VGGVDEGGAEVISSRSSSLTASLNRGKGMSRWSRRPTSWKRSLSPWMRLRVNVRSVMSSPRSRRVVAMPLSSQE